MGTKIGHYFDKQEEKYLPLVPQANSASCGRVFITDDTEENSAAEEKAVVLSPFAVNNKITTFQESVTTAYQGADNTLKEEITSAYEAADDTLKEEITSAYEAADEALEGKIASAYKVADESITNAYKAADEFITDAYQAADTALKGKITTAYEAADAFITSAYKTADESIINNYKTADESITKAYKAADEALEEKITSGTVAVAKKLETENDYTGAKILNFKDGTPSWYSSEDDIGSSTQPVYVNKNGEFSVCSGEMHSTTNASITQNGTTSLVLGNTSIPLISGVTLAMEGEGENAVTTGHIKNVTITNLSLNKAGNSSLGGVQSSNDLTFAEGKGTIANLNLSSVTVNGGSTKLQDTLDGTYLKKAGDTFEGNLIGDQSNIIFTGDNNGLLWRLDGVDYDLLKTDVVETVDKNGNTSQGHIYALGSTAFDTHIKGTSLHLQPSSGYLYINGAQGNSILNNASGIALGNDQSGLRLLSNSKGIHTDYPVRMHAARYHLHEGLGSGTSHDNGVPITYTNDKIPAQNRGGACLPLQLFSATSSFMDVIDGTTSNSKLFDRTYYWGDSGSDSNSTGYDLAENALVAKYNASLLVSGTIYANQLEEGSSIGGQIVYWSPGDLEKDFTVVAGRMETRLPAAATTGHVVIPPTIINVVKGSRIGLRCYTYTKSGYVPTHASDGTNITGRTRLDIVCLGLSALGNVEDLFPSS